MTRYLTATLALISLLCACTIQGQQPALTAEDRESDALVLCPTAFAAALRPWLDYRRQQGHKIILCKPGRTAHNIKQQIRHYARVAPLKHIVIVGDVPRILPTSMESAVPTDYVRAQVNVLYGSEPEIASDNPYADLDDDGIPELAIGRISVDTPQELTNQIDKIIRYESRGENGLWRRRINLVAGAGGFGSIHDQVIEKTTKRLITDLIPPGYDTSMTYASWSSPYCPDPRKFPETSLERLSEGCLFWVYMGHGHPYRLDYLRTPLGGFPILQRHHVEKIQCPNGMPIAVLLACYTGAFDLSRDCLAERMVRKSDGPVAAICGTRVTMPYGMSLLSLGLIESYFRGAEATLGEMLLAAKRHAIQVAAATGNDRPGEYRKLIDVLGNSLSPTADQLAQEKIEHLHLFHLLGDPLLKVARPESIEISLPASASGGEMLQVEGTSPAAGQLFVELCYPRDRFAVRPPRRGDFELTRAHLDQYQSVYERANDRSCVQKELSIVAGKFSTEIKIPEWARGRCVVRGYLDAGPRFALGSQAIVVKKR